MGTQKMLKFGKWAATVLAFASVGWLSWIPRSRTIEHKVATLTKLPLSFEVNQGQASSDARFVARGAGYVLLLTDRGESVLALHGRPRRPGQRRAERERRASHAPEPREPVESILLRLRFPGGNPSPRVQGEQPLPGRSNYLIGSDPGRWLTGVPHFARVRFQEIYPGVDLLYYTRDQQLEYDFIVRPGTNPDSIRLAVQGAQGIERSELGNLVLKTAAGRVLLHKPEAYQQGPAGEREVNCDYVLDPKGEVRFALGDYDRSRALRIDPVLSYAAGLDASIQAIVVDGSGNSVLAGSTSSSSFPTTPGVFQSAHGGSGDAVIAKLDSSGSTLLFATYLGGSGDDSADSIALDSSGNVIIAGRTQSTNFPVNNGVQSVLAGNTDAFLSKLNPTGMQLLYSTYLGGTGDDSARGMALDTNGRVLLTGVTNSADFPTTTGALRTIYNGNGDAFVSKVDTTQSGMASLLFSTYLGGNAVDEGMAVAVDTTNAVFVTGLTHSANFPTANPLQPGCASCAAGFEEAFVSKLNANGTALVYSTFLGGGFTDVGRAIAVDGSGSAYVAGDTSSGNFPTTAGAFQTSNRGGSDAFVSKLNPAGSALVYSSFLGGSNFDSARGIALDGVGNAYLTGLTYSGDFPTVSPLQGSNGVDCTYFYYYYYPYPYSCSDAIVPQVDSSGSMLIFSTYLGGAGGNDSGNGIAVDAAGNAYVAGTVGASTFPFTQGALPSSGGGFAAKINPMAAPGFAFDTQQIDLGFQSVGTFGPARSVLLRNMGSATLNITSISTAGDFAQTNNCGSSVAGGTNCSIQVTFAPTTLGPHSGMLIVNDSAAGSPHSIPLSGTGTQATATSLTSSLNPSSFGQAVTLTAVVTPLGATGTVNFRNSTTGAFLGSDLLDAGGMASVSTSTIPGGSNSIVAQYLGDMTFGPSTSPTLVQTVNQVATMTALASSANPSNQGQSVMFTATVTPAGATGQVSFRDGNTVISSVDLNASGIAAFSTSSLSGGNHSITAAYAGDGNFMPSTSAVVTQVVNSISLMAAQSSATVSRRGGTATFMLTVGQAGALSAPITFSCSGLLAGWNCTFTPNSVLAGSGPTPVTLAIQASGSRAQNLPHTPAGNRDLRGRAWPAALALLTVAVPLAAFRRRTGSLRLATLGVAALLLFSTGCGSDSPPAPRVVNVTVNATSGSTTASTTFAITLQ